MNNVPDNILHILDRQICGYHQYLLTQPFHPVCVSSNLCEMLGCGKQELLDPNHDCYADFVFPADLVKYTGFLKQLASAEQTLTEEYRLLRRDGGILYVRDTFSSKRSADGSMTGVSVLTDITDLKHDIDDLRFLNNTIPCGFLKYTCEKQPRVTYLNQKMIDLLRFPAVREGELDYLEMYKSNIFMMIPMEERRRFSKYLNRVYSADAPVAGEMSLLRCDGTRAYIFGWVTKTINEQGVPEFQSVCMDITERHKKRKKRETMRYIKALSDVYDKIFEFNLDGGTVECLHCADDPELKKLIDLPLQLEDALQKSLLDRISADNREAVSSFFSRFCRRELYEAGGRPPQITFKTRTPEGTFQTHTGIFLKADESVSFFCCRQMQDLPDAQALKTENIHLKEGIRELIMQFSDGIAAFEISPEWAVKPLYASENVCEFFGYTKEEWLPLTERFTPLENFVAYSEAAYDEFVTLLSSGDAEFTYFDFKTEKERRIKAICSQKEPGGTSSRYVLLYDVEDQGTANKPELPEKRGVSIRTFGYFDVFVGDKPIAFRNKKSKELFALLVDRRGGYVTSEEAISFLWEDEPVNMVTLSRCRKVALRLKNTLAEYGISDVMETVDGKRRIVMERVQCDLYDYLNGREDSAQRFTGCYLTNYSWGETTLGELVNSKMQDT